MNSPAERAGLALVGAAGLISALSTCALLSYLMFCLTCGARRSPLTIGIRNLVVSPLGKYLVSLLLADCIQGVAFIANFYWAAIGDIAPGAICGVQGIMSQIGDMGTALWAFAIALYTFWLLFLQRRPYKWLTDMSLVVLWALNAFMPILGSAILQPFQKRGSFWGPSGAWCWISVEYQIQRIPFLYFWVFSTLICSLIIYTLVYLKLTGVIRTDVHGNPCVRKLSSATGRRSLSQSLSESSHTSLPDSVRRGADGTTERLRVPRSVVRVARRLMWYPIVYAFVVTPVAVCRIGKLANWEPPFWLYIFAGVCFASSGTTNAALFLFTRHSFMQNVLRPADIRVTREQIVSEENELGLTPPSPLQFKSASSLTTPPESAISFEGHVREESDARAADVMVRWALPYEWGLKS